MTDMIETPNLRNAREDLLYIRKTIEAAGQFTAVPGKCLMGAGIVALAGVVFNILVTGAPWERRSSLPLALNTWGAVLAISVAIVSAGIYRKARQTGTRIQAPLLWKLLWSLCPSLFVGGIVTSLAVRAHELQWLPAIWLGCYGAAVTNGGQVSVVPVRTMGCCFLLAAVGAASSSPELGLAWLAVGFGWLHVIFGAYIARRHNG